MIDVDVVDDQDPTWIQGLLDAIQLESNIAFRVAAVVNEEVGGLQLRKHTRKPAST
jgi:hypothetical protein